MEDQAEEAIQTQDGLLTLVIKNRLYIWETVTTRSATSAKG